MSNESKPRALGGSPSGSVPLGYWTSIEVMNQLLIRYWGERAYQRSGRLLSHDVIDKSPVADLEHSAQIRTCVDVFWKALCSGEFEANVKKAAGEIERIPPDNWLSVYKYDLQINFTLGKAYAGVHSNSPLKPIDGATFLFKRDAIEQWLDGLVSEHLLPDPLIRDADALPATASVSLCQAITWLADSRCMSAQDFLTETLEQSGYLDAWVEGSKLEGLGDWKPDRIALEDFVATEMARTVRLNRARLAVQNAITVDELEAFGRHVSWNGQVGDLKKVDPDFFLFAVKLQYQHDQIGTDGEAEYPAYVESREAGYWESVRFRRSDLVRTWGTADGEALIEQTNTKSRKTIKKRGPKTKWDWTGAKAEFDRLMVENGPLSDTDLEWNRQAQIEVAISRWFEDRLRGAAPSESRIRYYVGPWLREFVQGL